MNKHENNQKIVMRMFLLFAFLTAQSPTWEIVQRLNQNAGWDEKIYLSFQIAGACIYTFLCVYFTQDRLVIENWGKKIPVLKKFFNILLWVSSLIFVWFPKLVLLIPELFSLCPSTNEFKQSKEEAKEQMVQYKNSAIYVRVFVGIGGITILIMGISYFVSQTIIQMIADTMNLILNFVLFVIVCTNIKSPFTTDISDGF